MKCCSICKIVKVTNEFNKNGRRLDGLQSFCRNCTKPHTKIIVNCVYCGVIAERRKDQIKDNQFEGLQWGCSSCTQKLVANTTERKIRQAELSRKQVIRQGGIPNAVHFTSERVRGAANNKWKGGITPTNVKLRTGPEAAIWRNLVFVRDYFTCQLCGQVGYKLQAHHNKEWANYPELRFEVDNGVTLCEDCHKNKAHQGNWHNTPVDIKLLKEECAI